MIASVQNDLVIDGDNSLDNSSSNTIFVLSEIYENAKKGIFNPKKFDFGDLSKTYSPVVNFYDCETAFETKPSNKITFKCLICKKI